MNVPSVRFSSCSAINHDLGIHGESLIALLFSHPNNKGWTFPHAKLNVGGSKTYRFGRIPVGIQPTSVFSCFPRAHVRAFLASSGVT